MKHSIFNANRWITLALLSAFILHGAMVLPVHSRTLAPKATADERDASTSSGRRMTGASSFKLSGSSSSVRERDGLAASGANQPKANGKIAFVSGRDSERLDIYVMNANGIGVARLTDGSSYNVSPAWSPGGTKLVFASNRDGFFNLYVMNADGSNVRRLTHSASDEGHAAWSPDGTRIVFARGFVGCLTVIGVKCLGPDLYVIDADGGNETRLTDDGEKGGGSASPTWSPDGTRIAFTTYRTGNSEIFSMNADGSNQTAITNNPDTEFDPNWSPDGTRIVFANISNNGDYNIYSMNTDGSARTNLTNNTSTDFYSRPVWSPDGTRIVFERALQGVETENRDLFVMNADGTNETRLTNHPDFDVEPAWQPLTLAASGRIAFTSERDGNAEVYAMNADGGAQSNLTNNPSRDETPVWSPDGTKILFSSERGGGTFQRQQFYVMNANGTGVVKITNFPDVTDVGFSDPAWSPDGTKIVYVASSFGAIHSLVVVNADGTGQARTVTTTRGNGGDVDPAWSPDGSRIAYVGNEFEPPDSARAARSYLYVINADGSGKTRIAEVYLPSGTAPRPSLGGAAWSPDGTRLSYTSNRDGNPEIYVVNAAGGNPARLTDNPAQDTLPVWSPDGARIAFTSTRDGNREIYVMNADGSNQTRLTNHPADDYDPDWQSLEPRGTLPPMLATIQFSDLSYNVPENNRGGVVITVTRLGDIAHEVSVNYTTVNLCDDTPGTPVCIRTASERSDFTTAAGTLHFAPGETSKSFTVLITDDLLVEGNEVLLLRLSNARGAEAGADAALIIVDNDTVPANGNPLDLREFFVRQQYLDFLNREPDEAGFNFWVNQIPAGCGFGTLPLDTRCNDARVNVSSAFFLSVEFQNTGYLVYRLYKSAFARFPRLEEFLPDTQEIGRGVVVNVGDWEQRLEANKQSFAREFVTRSAFRIRFPDDMTPTQFVDALNNNAGFVLTPPKREALIAELTANNNAEGRASVLRKVAEDDELGRREFNRAFVLMQYFGYLRRNPDDFPDHDFSGYNFWLNKLNQFGGDFRRAEMVNAFLTSGEYRNRFMH
ncbi:MAG TPA: Calx-beta domain-containing protein [Pyrinomonadaceae bacterium]